MGRPRKRRQPKALNWPAKGGGGYDPNSPIALKSRGPNTINIAAVVRDPTTKQLVNVEYQASTQRHGKRGLTIARAVGPTQVAINATGAPTVIPRAQVEARLEQMRKASDPKQRLKDRLTVCREEWQSLRRSGSTEFHRIVLREAKHPDGITFYAIELFFAGNRWIFCETNWDSGWQSLSITYRTRAFAMREFECDRICWSDTSKLPP